MQRWLVSEQEGESDEEAETELLARVKRRSKYKESNIPVPLTSEPKEAIRKLVRPRARESYVHLRKVYSGRLKHSHKAVDRV
jgi:hypothetical protein